MFHSMLPLPLTWPEDIIETLLLEAVGLPVPESGQSAPALPRPDLAAARARFGRGLHAARIHTRRGEYVAVWLEPGVEAEVDAAWDSGPEQGFWLHALARSLCLAAVRNVAPETAGGGCAPVPGPDPELAAALRLAGLACADPDGRHASLRLARRYAVVTHALSGGCGTCALESQCPRLRAAADTAQ